jgi:hypothetical protein
MPPQNGLGCHLIVSIAAARLHTYGFPRRRMEPRVVRRACQFASSVAPNGSVPPNFTSNKTQRDSRSGGHLGEFEQCVRAFALGPCASARCAGHGQMAAPDGFAACGECGGSGQSRFGGGCCDNHSERLHGGRGLHSFTFQLNLSAFCGIGGAYRGCGWGVRGC